MSPLSSDMLDFGRMIEVWIRESGCCLGRERNEEARGFRRFSRRTQSEHCRSCSVRPLARYYHMLMLQHGGNLHSHTEFAASIASFSTLAAPASALHRSLPIPFHQAHVTGFSDIRSELITNETLLNFGAQLIEKTHERCMRRTIHSTRGADFESLYGMFIEVHFVREHSLVLEGSESSNDNIESITLAE